MTRPVILVGATTSQVAPWVIDALRGTACIAVGPVPLSPRPPELAEAPTAAWPTLCLGLPPSEADVVVVEEKPDERKRLFEQLRAAGYRILSIVHPSAAIAPDAKSGEGCIVLPMSVIGPGVDLPDGAIVGPGGMLGATSTRGAQAYEWIKPRLL